MAAKSKLGMMEKEHLAEVEEQKRDGRYRTDDALDGLAKKLELIDGSMKTLRQIIIDDESHDDDK